MAWVSPPVRFIMRLPRFFLVGVHSPPRALATAACRVHYSRSCRVQLQHSHPFFPGSSPGSHFLRRALGLHHLSGIGRAPSVGLNPTLGASLSCICTVPTFKTSTRSGPGSPLSEHTCCSSCQTDPHYWFFCHILQSPAGNLSRLHLQLTLASSRLCQRLASREARPKSLGRMTTALYRIFIPRSPAAFVYGWFAAARLGHSREATYRPCFRPISPVASLPAEGDQPFGSGQPDPFGRGFCWASPARVFFNTPPHV